MSKTEGIGNSIERIDRPSEEEVAEIYEEFEEVKTTASHGQRRLHPVGEDGEPLCTKRENHNVRSWSNAKPIFSYPPGYRPLCLYCVREWRGSE